jgi:hypothetical protein
LLQPLPQAIFVDEEAMQSLGLGMPSSLSIVVTAAAAAAAIPCPNAFGLVFAESLAASMPHGRREHRGRGCHAANTIAAAAAAAAAAVHRAAAAVGGHSDLYLVSVFLLLQVLFITFAHHRGLSLSSASIGFGVIKGLARVR